MIEEVEGSDNEVSLYDNVPNRISGSTKQHKNQHRIDQMLRPRSPKGSRNRRGPRKSSGGSEIDRVRYPLKYILLHCETLLQSLSVI